jgi:hypothetical protein
VSLIDDALKRAQEEAARQDEAHRRASRPWIAPQPARARSRAGGIAALALSFLLAAAGSAWFLARRRAPVPPKAPVPAPRVAIVASPLSAAPPSSRATPLESVEVSPPPSAYPVPETPKSRRGAAPAAAFPPGAAEATPPTVRPPRATPPLPDGKTFVRTVTPPGEDPIELDGIVFSETNPVAVIGGHLLGPGASIGSFEIVKIEENRVTLRGRGVTIFLTPS